MSTAESFAAVQHGLQLLPSLASIMGAAHNIPTHPLPALPENSALPGRQAANVLQLLASLLGQSVQGHQGTTPVTGPLQTSGPHSQSAPTADPADVGQQNPTLTSVVRPLAQRRSSVASAGRQYPINEVAQLTTLLSAVGSSTTLPLITQASTTEAKPVAILSEHCST